MPHSDIQSTTAFAANENGAGMKTSTDRILTTHIGSLPRPDDLFEMMLERMDGKPVDDKVYAARVQRAVNESVREQAAAGLDIVSDGEMGKPSFITYAASRLDGLTSREGSRPSPFATSRETIAFPGLLRVGARAAGYCTAPPVTDRL